MAASTVKLVNRKEIPVVGLGTWQCEDEKELELALNTALENGYRHIDTAYAYKNEFVIGRVLQQWLSSGKIKRAELFITTKLPMEAVNPDRVEKYFNKSLSDLQLDYVDLYLIHFPVTTKPRDVLTDPLEIEPNDLVAVWRKLETLVDGGRAKAIGISNFNIKQVEKIVKNARIKPASLQIESHIFLPQNELVKFAQDNAIVVVAYSPLGSPGIGKFYAKFGKEPKPLSNILEDPTVKRIAEKHKKSPAQVALKFHLQRNVVVIPKSVTANRVKQNISLFDFTLDDGDLKALRGLEIGEAARVCDFAFFPKLTEHPEWPFTK